MRRSPCRSLETLSQRVVVAAALLLAAEFACAAARDPVTEEVIVEGTRPEVEQRVNTFVKGITHRGYAVESLVRWNKPICPLVAGIPANQGEFILHRISQAALAAGAKLAGEKCKPNFHVVLTPQPDELLDRGANARRACTAWRRRRKCAVFSASRGRFESGTTCGTNAAKAWIPERSSAPTQTLD